MKNAERYPLLARAVIAGALVVMAVLYTFFTVRAHWSGKTWWERASYETAHGHNIYALNYQIWLTHSEPEPWFIYGPGSLYVTVPLYSVARCISGDDTPDLFARLCVILAMASHAGLVLVGARIVRRQSNSPGAAAATLAALALNPILLRLGAMGDILDLPMLCLCALYLHGLVQGQFRRAGIWLSLAFIVKQFPLLLFPDFIIRAARARRRDAMVWSALPAFGLSLPFLVWSPREYLFFLAGNVSAWREIYRGEWWNVFGFLANSGVPEVWLKTASFALLTVGLILVYRATWRKRLSGLMAAALISNAFWILYHSSHAVYIGWGLTFATIALGSFWRLGDDP